MNRSVSISAAIEDVLLLDECSLEDEWEGQVVICRCDKGCQEALQRSLGSKLILPNVEKMSLLPV